jgi:hypothetical protein
MTLRKLLPLALLLLALPAAAGTPTAHYAWSKPTVAADADTWGTQLDGDLDGIDAVVFGKLDLSGGVMSGTETLAAGTTTLAPLKFTSGSLLTAPVAGAEEWDGTHLYITQTSGPARRQLAFIDEAITGSAATLTTARSIGMTGDVVWTSAGFNGAGNVTGTATIQAGAVTAADLHAGAAAANLGFTPANVAGDTFTGKLTAKASTAGGAGFNLAPGSAPSSPVNGDCWVTATAVQCRVGGVTSTLGSTSGSGLLSTNNLSDVADVATSRTNLGLTSAATTAIGTSGATIPLVNGANSWGATQTLMAGTTSNPALKLTAGSNLTTPAAGAVEWDGASLYLTQTSGPTRKTVAFTDSALSGSTTGSAATLTTGRTIGMTGDVTWTSASFNGSGNVTGTATIQAGAVSNADLAGVASGTIKGRSAAGSGAPSDLSAATARAVILPAFAGHAGQALSVNAGETDAAWSGFAVFASGYVTVSGTTPTLVAANNVSSVTRTGGGAYAITLSNAAPSANFAAIVFPSGGNTQTCAEDSGVSRTTTSFGIACANGGGAHDPGGFSILVVAQ